MDGQLTEADQANPGDDNLDDDRVAAYLCSHPDFFTRRPELLRRIALPERWNGDTVVDIHGFVVESLRGELAGLRDCASVVIENSRVNQAIQSRTHAAVLHLIGAPDLGVLLRIIADDLPPLLDVDVGALAVEKAGAVDLFLPDVPRLGVGAVEHLVGSGQPLKLYRDFADDGAIFGAASGLVRSAALCRLRIEPSGPAALFALGARDAAAFHPGQGTELLRFLSDVVEVCLNRILSASI